MNDNFLLYKNAKDFSFEIFEYIENIPKKFTYIKCNIQDTLNNIIKLIRYYIVNINDTNRIKVKYLKDLVVELSMIDFYIEFLYKFDVLGKNKYNYFSKKLEELRKISYCVINNEKKFN